MAEPYVIEIYNRETSGVTASNMPRMNYYLDITAFEIFCGRLTFVYDYLQVNEKIG
jgi:hypothetical protein